MYITYYLYLLFCCVILLYVVNFFIKYFKRKKVLSAIPSPPGQIFLGNIFLVLKDPDTLFIKLRELAAKYQPIFRLSTFYIDIVNLLDPNDIEILLSSTKHLSKSKIYSFLNQWLGTGLLTSTGSKWHNRRKILTPAFHFSILQQFIHIFNDEAQKLVEELEKHVDQPSISIIPPVTHFTLQSIAETAMGLENIQEKTLTEYKEAIYKMGKILFKRLSQPLYRFEKIYNLSSLGQEEKAVVQILHNFSNNIIAKREKQAVDITAYSKRKRMAMLDLLLSAKANGAEIDHEGIREEVDTFMFEGHDTTSMAISFVLLCLANNPEIQNKVLAEILEVVGSSKIPSYNDLQQLRYTERCIKEALRLFPSVPFISRYAGEDFVTATGYTVPKDTIVHVHIFDLHRNPKIYPDPLRFDPDRFLPEVANERHPFAYIPFSAGPRNCIGQRYALLELKAVLCSILRKLILIPIDGMYDVMFRPDLVLRPVNDVRIKLALRVLENF